MTFGVGRGKPFVADALQARDFAREKTSDRPQLQPIPGGSGLS